MAADGIAFAISLGLNLLTLALCYAVFGVARNVPFLRKFYEPRRYMRVPNRHKPKRLPTGYVAWLGVVHRATQDEVVDVAGPDAAAYLMFLKFCKELFFFTSLWALATVLPTNMVGREVDRLEAAASYPKTAFTYWVPPGPPAGSGSGALAQSSAAAFPDFYDENIPPPPPALKWWKYKEGVPPLPPAPPGYGWKYDETRAPMDYDVSNLDKLTASNVAPSSATLLVHSACMWAVTLYAFRLLWSYSTQAVALRIRHLTSTVKGAQTHSVLVTDIPGVEAGTFSRRLDETLFGALPVRVKRPMKRMVSRAFDLVEKGVSATAGRVADVVILGDADAAARARPRTPQKDRFYDAIDFEEAAAEAGLAGACPAHESSGATGPAARGAPGAAAGTAPAGASPRSPAPPTSPFQASSGSVPPQAPAGGRPASAPPARGGATRAAPAQPRGRAQSVPEEEGGVPTAPAVVTLAPAPSPYAPPPGSEGGGGGRAGYVARAPRHAAPANLPPKDPTAYVARTEITAWKRAADALAAGATMEAVVAREFGQLFPGEVADVNAVYTARHLSALQAQYAGTQAALTDLMDDYAAKKRRHIDVVRRQIKVRGSDYGDWGKARYGGGLHPKHVDALSFYLDRLTELRRAVKDAMALAVSRTEAAAFVTFKSRRTQVLAASALLHHDVSAWHTQDAPAPGDVIWASLRLRAWERSVRGVIGWVILLAFALVFLVPVVGIQTMLELPRLAKLPAFSGWITFPVVRSIVQCILPSFFLNVILYAVPAVLALLARLAGMASRSAVDARVVDQHFVFLVVTVFCGSFVSGSVLNQLSLWARHPGAAFTILGTAAPLTSIFFLNFICFVALATAPFALLRLPSMVLYCIKTRAASTERAKARLWQDQFQSYGGPVPRASLVALLGLVFAPINPLVPPFSLAFFLMLSITEKYNLLYVRREAWQAGGALWPRMAGQLTASLLIAQVVLFLLLAIKRAPWVAATLLPLLAITALFRVAARELVERPFSVLSLRAAVDLDANDGIDDLPGAAGGGEAAAAAYRQPDLQFDEDAHEALVAEATHMDSVLKSDDELRRQIADYNYFGSPSPGQALPGGLGAAARTHNPFAKHKTTGLDIV